MTAQESNISTSEKINIFDIHHRFLRSTQLERDWADADALNGYVVTPLAEQNLKRLLKGLKPNSGQRAWRVTGDYGSGKSSFALLIANLFSQRRDILPIEVSGELLQSTPELFEKDTPFLWPVLITGSKEPFRDALMRALITSLQFNDHSQNFLGKLNQVLGTTPMLTDQFLLEWLQNAIQHIIQKKLGDGLLLIIDEMGKFLEFAAAYPEEQDVYLLQSLAEIAARSRKKCFYIIGCLHQGINQYTETLAKSQQREWEKVAGRYEEIIWHFPVEQAALLITKTLNTRLNNLKQTLLKSMKKDMDACLSLGWLGLGVDQRLLSEIAEQLYPLHPTVLPVLIRLFSSVGQNERSLYTFLLGTEPSGLQDFVNNTNGSEIYRLHHLFDYFRNNFRNKLALTNYHWKEINNTINSYSRSNSTQLNVLKTIGLLNVLNADDLIPTKEIIELALSSKETVNSTLSELSNSQIIFNRGRAEGYSLWSNNSVNLQQAYEQAKKIIGSNLQLNLLIRDRLDPRPIVARRHYIKTGNLRYFEVKYFEINDLEKELSTSNTADGTILVPLCKDAKEVRQAVLIAANQKSIDSSTTLIIVPKPLQKIQSYLEELQRWQWIERSIGELRQDRFAREEVGRQIAKSQQELDEQLQLAIGIVDVNRQQRLTCYYDGSELQNIYGGRSLMQLLSQICDKVYYNSPIIHNELINRKILSGAAATARSKLLQQLFEFSTVPFLGMDSEKHPPEMSIYLSVLLEAGFHGTKDNDGEWKIALPDEGYDKLHSKVLPVMNFIHSLLAGKIDSRVLALDVFDELKKPPFGIKEGVIPIILAVFIVIHEQELAYYEDGNFTSRMIGSVFLRLIKAPETFEIQYYPIEGVRNELFQKLADKLNLPSEKQDRVELLDVIKPLMVFVAQLPEYVIKTGSLSGRTQKVRSKLTKTTDPIQLLFYDLPQACSLPVIDNNDKIHVEVVEKFADAMKEVVDEMRMAYSKLIDFIEEVLLEAYEWNNSKEEYRSHLAERAERLIKSVTEIRLKSFCLKLADKTLSRKEWLESLGNLICSMPPHKWKDTDKHKFDQEIQTLTQQFMRVEALLYRKVGKDIDKQSVRVALTQPSGEERIKVIHLSAEQINEVKSLEKELKNLIKSRGQFGLAAASNIIWEMLKTS